MITAGVFIYIIIITALPRGARGERQGLGRDEGWDRSGGGREGGREEVDSENSRKGEESSC